MLSQHFLDQSQAVFHQFTKWVIEPTTGRFPFIPDDRLTHKVQILASALQELIPFARIRAANKDSPNNTTFINHTERPYLRINQADTITQHTYQHDIMWELTDVLITDLTSHKNWAHNKPQLTTDDQAQSASPASQIPAGTAALVALSPKDPGSSRAW